MINSKGEVVKTRAMSETKLHALLTALVNELQSGRWDKRLGYREVFDATMGLQKVQIRLIERKLRRLGVDDKPADLY